jgi:hypothetical protein
MQYTSASLHSCFCRRHGTTTACFWLDVARHVHKHLPGSPYAQVGWDQHGLPMRPHNSCRSGGCNSLQCIGDTGGQLDFSFSWRCPSVWHKDSNCLSMPDVHQVVCACWQLHCSLVRSGANDTITQMKSPLTHSGVTLQRGRGSLLGHM